MGLDWILNKAKPRPGNELRFTEINAKMQQMRKEGVEPGPKTQHEFDEVSISCFVAIGAPRVGHDDAATEFFRENCYQPARVDALKGQGSPEFRAFWGRSFEECLEDHRGLYVAELAKERGGVASVTGVVTGSLDFRGKIVGGSEKFLGAALALEAYRDHTAEECLDYARRLEEALLSKIGAHGRRYAVPLKEALLSKTCALEDDQKEQVGHLCAAVGWLRFWGERGYGFSAWA